MALSVFWLISLSLTFWRPIRVVTKGSLSSFLLAEECPLCMRTVLPSSSPLWRTLWSFLMHLYVILDVVYSNTGTPCMWVCVKRLEEGDCGKVWENPFVRDSAGLCTCILPINSNPTSTAYWLWAGAAPEERTSEAKFLLQGAFGHFLSKSWVGSHFWELFRELELHLESRLSRYFTCADAWRTRIPSSTPPTEPATVPASLRSSVPAASLPPEPHFKSPLLPPAVLPL